MAISELAPEARPVTSQACKIAEASLTVRSRGNHSPYAFVEPNFAHGRRRSRKATQRDDLRDAVLRAGNGKSTRTRINQGNKTIVPAVGGPRGRPAEEYQYPTITDRPQGSPSPSCISPKVSPSVPRKSRHFGEG